MENKSYDSVNHPEHYTYGKYECIDVMLDVFGDKNLAQFCKMNAFKYLFRSEHKNGIEDIKKAIWYLNKYVDLNSEIKLSDPIEDIKKRVTLLEDLHNEQIEQM